MQTRNASRQIFLDTETTGLDPKRGHKLTEIGCVEVIDRRPTGNKYHTYLNPEREIDKDALAITNLTNEFLSDKPKFIEIADEFIQFLQGDETEIVIHNAPFDLGFLNHELSLIKHPFGRIEEKISIIDTLAMARRLHPGQKNNLDALCKRYNVNNSHREFHGAMLDANLLIQVYLRMTAGQSSLILKEETPAESSQVQKNTVRKINRAGYSLVVIRATEEESRAHEARMASLEK